MEAKAQRALPDASPQQRDFAILTAFISGLTFRPAMRRIAERKPSTAREALDIAKEVQGLYKIAEPAPVLAAALSDGQRPGTGDWDRTDFRRRGSFRFSRRRRPSPTSSTNRWQRRKQRSRWNHKLQAIDHGNEPKHILASATSRYSPCTPRVTVRLGKIEKIEDLGKS